VIVAVVVTETDLVVTVNVAILLPAATVTEIGTVAEVLLLDSETFVPPEGALLVKVTVPCTEVPPAMLAGLSETDETVAAVEGEIVSAAVLLRP